MKPATSPPSDPGHRAAFIFIHGLGDHGSGFASSSSSAIQPHLRANLCLDIADQFQAANKLSHMQWIFPHALENRDAMQPAWYAPSPLSPFASSRPELDDPEDEDGMKASMSYIVGLIDGLVSKGIPPNRIVLGGFSQGCAMTLLTGLTSRAYAGRLAGLVGLSGYLPLAEKIQQFRAEAGLPEVAGDVPMFLVRGTRDILVPKRYLRICLETLRKVGADEGSIEVHEYDIGHVVSPQELRDLCAWLERVVPALE